MTGYADKFEIVCGDSMLVMHRWCEEGRKFDAVITDPPYSSGGQFRSDRSGGTGSKYGSGVAAGHADFYGDSRDQRSYEKWVALWSAQALALTIPGGVICAFTDWRQIGSTIDAIQAGGWIYRGIVVWDKITARPQTGRFSAKSEFIVWGSRGSLDKDRGVGCLDGLVRCGTDNSYHQTGKPIPVMQHLVELCAPGGSVLDPFCGSGSTGVAALRLGRRFAGIEMSEHYAEIAAARLRAEVDGGTMEAQQAGQASLFGVGSNDGGAQ